MKVSHVSRFVCNNNKELLTTWLLLPMGHNLLFLSTQIDFTRLKLVQGKKEEELKKEAALKENAKAAGAAPVAKENDADITAAFDATDDEDVVF